ncbi:unnamed protein product, partial [Closterium sp. Naga37s-1]
FHKSPPAWKRTAFLCIHQQSSLSGTAGVHNVTGLACLQSHEGAEPSVQPARFHHLPRYLLHTPIGESFNSQLQPLLRLPGLHLPPQACQRPQPPKPRRRSAPFRSACSACFARLWTGSYVAVNDGHGDPFKVNAQVTDPSGQQLHWQHDVAEGHFGFTADETGEFSVCFWLPHEGHHDAKRTHKIDITWTTGKSQKSVSHGAKKERLDHFDLELQNLEDAIDKVTQEMSFFHERELAMRMKTEETHVYVAWLSVASLLVCGTIAALQLWHLKRFFERKKLL